MTPCTCTKCPKGQIRVLEEAITVVRDRTDGSDWAYRLITDLEAVKGEIDASR